MSGRRGFARFVATATYGTPKQDPMFRLLTKMLAGLALVLLAYIAVGGLMSALAGAPPMRGRMIDIGDGRHMRIVCEGPPVGAGPTVLFEAGAFGFAADWGAVQRRLAERGERSCAYDRAGLGYSDPGPEPRDSLHIVSDLEKLLAAANEKGPFILVGHSMAGLHTRLFAVRNPDKIVGVVLVDATTPEAMDVKLVRDFVGHFDKLSQLAAWGASAGLYKPLVATWFGDKIGLPPDVKVEKRWAFASARHNRWAAAEVKQWQASAEESRAAGAFAPALPVAVVTAGSGAGRAGWKDVQAVPARQSRDGYYENVPEASHASLLGLDHADAIVKAIDHVRHALAPVA